ncbi:unnamed protein product [Brachionus calyciflorus]|uniref:Uncharacterized protein n=1 Tax=Brachionus calyciflorus TaxID=104777 RepID=A0A813MB14_9BILA|nr:unnamed protein product [Brachionus calyciflorus]
MYTADSFRVNIEDPKVDLSRLASQEEILKFLIENVKDHSECINKNHLDLIKNIFKNAEGDDSQNINNFIYWARKTKFIKLVEQDVPSNILNDASLYDIKVQTRGPDDRVFDRNADIRAKIARGNTILEYKENGSTKYKLLIYALRKFTGGLGDEDEFDRKSGEWRKYFLKDIKYTKHVVSLQKANGEAAHFSCSWINNDFLLCAGSKNVHLVFKKREHISQYSDARYELAKVISNSVFTLLQKMNPELKKNLLSFLCWSNLTIVFEILVPNSQHIEDLSCYKEPFLQFITFTENKVYERPRSLCPMPPDCATEIANAFGLSGVKYDKIPLDKIDDFLIKARKDYGHEGFVLYFIDSDLNLIGMLKKKTTWYIILRALREKIRSYLSTRSTMSLDDLKSKVKIRLYDIKAWIGFSSNDLTKWENLCCEFCKWFDKAYRKNSNIKTDFYERYPVLWNQFIKETNLSDRIQLHIEKSSYTKLGEEKENNDQESDEKISEEGDAENVELIKE